MNLELLLVNVTEIIGRNIMTCGYHTKNQQSCGNYRVVAESSSNALNFDHISQVENLVKRRKLFKK